MSVLDSVTVCFVFCFLSTQIFFTYFSTKEARLQLMYMKTLYSALHMPTLIMVFLLILVIISLMCVKLDMISHRYVVGLLLTNTFTFSYNYV